MIKFGCLAVCLLNAKLKSAKIFYHMHIHVRMAIPYHTTKFGLTLSPNLKLGEVLVLHYLWMSNSCQNELEV